MNVWRSLGPKSGPSLFSAALMSHQPSLFCQCRAYARDNAGQWLPESDLSCAQSRIFQSLQSLLRRVLRAGRLAQAGQQVQWLQRVQGGARMHDAAVPPGLHVVYEDADLACVVKPQGMPVAVRPSRSTCMQCDRPALRLSPL